MSKKTPSKKELAYKEIQNAILTNKYPPGTQLVERRLSEVLKISRTPIREALRHLENNGYVNIIPDTGVFVSKIRLNDMIEMFELREALERMAVRLFIDRKNEADLEAIRECYRIQQAAMDNGDIQLAIDKDVEFHGIYVKGARNERLRISHNGIYDQIARLANLVVNDEALMTVATKQHGNILWGIEKGDKDMAENAVKQHFKTVREYHISKYYKYIDYNGRIG